jgi:prepilin-type N-terminal cleavage/methylation domain-containing protein
MKQRRGFTLIELLVVIAIIGILSSVVLASLNTARGRGANASVKSNLSAVRSQAQLYLDDAAGGNGSFGSFAYAICPTAAGSGHVFLQSTIVQQIASANTAGGGGTRCSANGTDWAVSVALRTAEGVNTHWCTDSNGASRGRAGFHTTGTFNCN